MLDAAIKIISILKDAGYDAYLAGGCVRDRLLGKEPKDFDVATSAKPRELADIFHNTQLVGEAFGVVLVRLMGCHIEVATFRTEWGYTDGRRPDGVSFTDAEHDAQRRDFTINGLFEDPLENKIIDYVGGQEDLKDGIIRAIGDPDRRFNEDYLRLLRAIRFAARMDFEIETRTARAIRNHARYLGQISRERIGIEVDLMFAGSVPAKQRKLAAKLIQDLHLDGPTLNEDHRDVKLPTLGALPDHDDVDAATCLAAWMLDRHARHGVDLPAFMSQGFERTMTQWRNAMSMSNEQRDAIVNTLRVTAKLMQWDDLTIAGKKRLLAQSRFAQGRILFEAMIEVQIVRAIADELKVDVPRMMAEGVNPEPWVGGSDLIELGLKPGPEFGEWLDQAYDAQLDGTVCDRQQALAWIKSKVLGNSSGDGG
jgi:poly(A) polymerase